MSMEARIVGIGKFKKELVDALGYPEKFYDDTKEGVPVSVSFFQCNTSSQSKELAQTFEIEPWDFNTFHIKKLYPVIFNNLVTLWWKIKGYSQQETEEYVNKFIRCFNAGFIFVFEPNG